MRKIVHILPILALIALLSIGIINSLINNTTSYITVLDKEKSNGKYWITVINPFDTNKKKLKMKVDSKNTWNLIQNNKTYLGTYEYLSIDWSIKLVEIERSKSFEDEF